MRLALLVLLIFLLRDSSPTFDLGIAGGVLFAIGMMIAILQDVADLIRDNSK